MLDRVLDRFGKHKAGAHADAARSDKLEKFSAVYIRHLLTSFL
jgi:hypothetical protein